MKITFSHVFLQISMSKSRIDPGLHEEFDPGMQPRGPINGGDVDGPMENPTMTGESIVNIVFFWGDPLSKSKYRFQY